jgi:hypothetical protein
MRVVYAHHEPLTFTDYLNLETGQTLAAVPGGTYDIAPASGRVVPELPEPWFVRVASPGVGAWIGESRELTSEGTPAEGDGVPPEPGGEQEDGTDLPSDDPEQGSAEG